MGGPVIAWPLGRMAACTILAVTLCSCYAYRRPSAESSTLDTERKPAPSAYVHNADMLPLEYSVLRHSGRYRLIADSTLAEVSIRLHPVQANSPYCITPQVTALAITLGLVPVPFYESYEFSFTTSKSGKEITQRYSLDLVKRVSWFHLFIPRKNRRRAMGRALAAGSGS